MCVYMCYFYLFSGNAFYRGWLVFLFQPCNSSTKVKWANTVPILQIGDGDPAVFNGQKEMRLWSKFSPSERFFSILSYAHFFLAYLFQFGHSHPRRGPGTKPRTERVCKGHNASSGWAILFIWIWELEIWLKKLDEL